MHFNILNEPERYNYTNFRYPVVCRSSILINHRSKTLSEVIIDYGKKCSVNHHGKKQNFLANKHMKNFVFFLFNGPRIKEEKVEFYQYGKDSELSGICQWCAVKIQLTLHVL